MKTSVEVICYKARPLKNGEYPLMLRITKSRRRKYVSIGLSVDPKFWDFAKKRPKRNCPDRENIIALIDQNTLRYSQQITEYKAEGRDYTLNSLVQRVESPIIKHSFGSYLDQFIQSLIIEKRLGYAKTVHALKSSIQSDGKTLDFYFTDIDVLWLRGYELFLRERNNAENTIGIRFRSLRVLYNRAITDNVVKQGNYPFDAFKVSKFHEQTNKRAIIREDIKRIIDLDLRTISTYHYPYLELGRDVFIFSYLSCGMNLTDIANLKYTNIVNDRVTYNRQKTGKLLTFQLQPLARIIMEKYRKGKAVPQDYVFPILDMEIHKTETQKRERIKKANKAINRALRRISAKLELPIDLTTYVARHTYATVLKRSGVNIAIISETLGHSDLATTQIYLDSFENSQIDEAMKNLL
jgi:integrase